MEFSPLRFLDSDVSELLCEQVKLSKERLSREYHIELYNTYNYKYNYTIYTFIF